MSNLPPPPPSPASGAALGEQIDFDVFRNALRLIHCVQKERGASCAFFAANAAGDRDAQLNRVFGEALWQARTASDAAVRLLKNAHKNKRISVSVASTLAKIRPLVADAPSVDAVKPKNSANDNDGLLFHRIFVCFNSLVAAISQEYILSHVYSYEQPSKIDRTKKIPANRHRRGLSLDIDKKLSPSWALSPPDVATRKKYPEPPETLAGDVAKPSALTSQSRDASISFLKDPDTSSNIVQKLFQLLGTFVQLKESTGIERAILSSLLVLKDRAEDSRLVNDLVLEVEQQRHLLSKLNGTSWHYNHSLIIELTSLSPALMEWQQHILTDGVSSLSINQNDSWNILTCYIDKLHSMELLLVEEIESEMPGSGIMASPQSATPTIVEVPEAPPLPISTPAESKSSYLEDLSKVVAARDASVSSVMSAIESMPAEELKSRMLAMLGSSDKKADRKSLMHSRSTASVEDDLVQDVTTMLAQKAQEVSTKEWEIGIYEVKFKRRIGQGSSGTTYLGTWSGQSVAVKVASITEFGLEGWRTEIITLQKIHHPNVIRLLGSIFHSNPMTLGLVLEYCDAGDLEAALRHPTPKNFFFHVSNSISNACQYLHHKGILHRDLKPSNVLCDGNISTGKFTVKVTDFGVAAVLKTGGGGGLAASIDTSSSSPSGLETILNNSVLGPQRNLTGETGTYRWMAPEVMRHEPYSNLCDTYSFAVMAWQFLTREEPFENESDRDAAGHVAIEKIRPPFPDGTPVSIRELITACWSDDPANRWPFEKISKALEEIHSSLSLADRTWIEDSRGHPVYNKEFTSPENFSKELKKSSSSGISPAKLDKKHKVALADKDKNKKPSLLSSLFSGSSSKVKGKR